VWDANKTWCLSDDTWEVWSWSGRQNGPYQRANWWDQSWYYWDIMRDSYIHHNCLSSLWFPTGASIRMKAENWGLFQMAIQSVSKTTTPTRDNESGIDWISEYYMCKGYKSKISHENLIQTLGTQLRETIWRQILSCNLRLGKCNITLLTTMVFRSVLITFHINSHWTSRDIYIAPISYQSPYIGIVGIILLYRTSKESGLYNVHWAIESSQNWVF